MEKVNDETKDNISFLAYYNAVNGASITINSNTNELHIYSTDDIKIASLRIGRSAKMAGLDIHNMLSNNTNVFDYQYLVLLNGHENANWLFAVKVVKIV
jgi:hypothetical protein